MIYLFSSSKHEDVLNMPIIEFKTLQDSIDLSNYDLLLFTSKNAVMLIDKINKEWKNIPSIVIGKESADVISKLGGDAIFISNGYSKNLSYDIKQKFANKKILYIRPKIVATKYITDLAKEKNIDIDEFVLYETVCRRYDISQKPSTNSVLIFTSPSAIECFMDNFKSLEGYKIVVIGETTAKALPKKIKYHISNTPNINECIKLALKL